jgi:hypothetical protein
MSLFAPPPKPRTLPPEDTHIGRIYSVVDLGTQSNTHEGQTRLRRKVLVQWELPNARHIFDPAKGEEPFTVSREYSLTMDPKGSLRKMVEAISGKFKDDKEASKFDVFGLVGQPSFLQLTHVTSDGKTYANIASITKPPKGTEVPPQWYKPVTYDSNTGASPVYKALPEWLQKKIALSPEFKEATLAPF